MSSLLWTPLSGRAAIMVSGSERVRWLDGMVSQNVMALAVGDVAPTLVLTHQGRIVGDPWIWMFEDHILLDLEAAAVAPVQAHLQKLIIADDVRLCADNTGFLRFSLEGEGAWAFTAQCLGFAPTSRLCRVSFAGEDLVVAPHALVAAEGVQWRVTASQVERLWAEFFDHGPIEKESAESFERRRLQQGIPWYGKELDSTVLPAEARLERAISIDKGCYAGQEVVARMRSRGRVSTLLMTLTFEDDVLPEIGSDIMAAGKKVGELTSMAKLPDQGSVGLGYVNREVAEAGGVVEVSGSQAALSIPAFALRP